MKEIRAVPGVSQVTARAYAPVLAALHETGETALVTGVELEKERQPQGLLEMLNPSQLPAAGEAPAIAPSDGARSAVPCTRAVVR